MFGKNLDDVTYDDIVKLQEEKVDESDILDYKEDFQKEDEIIKHVCAFANTRGGYLVFGVKESKDGGHPTKITGVDDNKIHKEKIENLMLSNIAPRMDIKIKAIAVHSKKTSILLVQIPDSYNKPHYNQKNNKFYKRYNFQSNEMTEQEIADSYRRRFSSYDRVEQYVHRLLENEKKYPCIEYIVVIPSNIEYRLIDTFDHTKYEWLRNIQLKHSWGPYASSNNFFQSSLQPFADGLYSENEKGQSTEIHRNGCIFHIYLPERQLWDHSANRSDDDSYYNLLPGMHAVHIMHTLQAASQIMSHYNYLGEMKIVTKNICPPNTQLLFGDGCGKRIPQNLTIQIERVLPLQHIKTNYQEIAADIMHEVVNHFGVERCDLFDKDGKWIKDY